MRPAQEHDVLQAHWGGVGREVREVGGAGEGGWRRRGSCRGSGAMRSTFVKPFTLVEEYADECVATA